MRLSILLVLLALTIAGALYGVRSGAIDVPPDWNPWATLDVHAEPNFLTRHKSGACRFFDAVLGPDYNDAHRDHLHFDRGPYRACR